MAATDDGDLGTRIRFLRIGANDLKRLQDFWQIVEPKLPAILDGFYSHVTSEPRLKAIVADRVTRLKQAQTQHWRRLFTGSLDAGYTTACTRSA